MLAGLPGKGSVVEITSSGAASPTYLCERFRTSSFEHALIGPHQTAWRPQQRSLFASIFLGLKRQSIIHDLYNPIRM
jgi:hypothetical protein